MKSNKTMIRIASILNYVIAIALIISGALKLIGLTPYVAMIKDLSPNYYSNIYLLGFIAIGSGLLFIIPRTFTYGLIASLVFLGGTISAHMQHGDIYVPQVVFVLLTAFVAWAKKPEWFNSNVSVE